jgi:hypothetical protein
MDDAGTQSPLHARRAVAPTRNLGPQGLASQRRRGPLAVVLAGQAGVERCTAIGISAQWEWMEAVTHGRRGDFGGLNL